MVRVVVPWVLWIAPAVRAFRFAASNEGRSLHQMSVNNAAPPIQEVRSVSTRPIHLLAHHTPVGRGSLSGSA